MAPIKVSVLIVNFNGRHLLADCLDSVRRHLHMPHEVIVVDNASHDGSVEFVREHYPEVKLIAHGINAGFTGGNNIAAAHAVGRYLLLLNTDTVVRSAIDPIADLMDRHPSFGALGCRLIYGDGRPQESIGLEFSALGLGLSWFPLGRLMPKGRLTRRTEPADSVLYASDLASVDWVSGAFLMTPRALWEELGGLDDAYFMYMEDVDYCKRVRASGRAVMYSALCHVTHYEGAGRKWIGERAVLNTVNSYGLYFKKFHTPLQGMLLTGLLSSAFSIRAAGHGLMALLGKDPVGREKFQAYAKAAWQTWRWPVSRG
jgi:N-acetylglucosaminyl-diphospho-decaprenol L-rhamnosyltransferase